MKQSPTIAHAGNATVVTARDLMSPNPVSLEGSATLPEVLAFLTDTGYSAAPVLDVAGRPVGVLSRTDVVVYERARAAADEPGNRDDAVRAADLMTPTLFSVAPGMSACAVAREMVRKNVHRLFVMEEGVLVGVISALDLLKHFCAEEAPESEGTPARKEPSTGRNEGRESEI
jgi:CBS domain-containing protein